MDLYSSRVVTKRYAGRGVLRFKAFINQSSSLILPTPDESQLIYFSISNSPHPKQYYAPEVINGYNNLGRSDERSVQQHFGVFPGRNGRLVRLNSTNQ